ncbi:CpaD family pilus assembly protein [Erythrobacter sp. YJ-T3-07]|uniref:CpaD family pilus assembly protein n=1 Tax=Erythrobacter sp. YJ-T3-07 TaxID=2793063 RepID=UPI0018D3DB9F|nr:CpaD family pilus assembly protein [Erythrobacter sp. YJ-T3-07]MBH1944781.1 CpaD family pilus assembly protein [Erythrobacter sp. YJ-T3-07]
MKRNARLAAAMLTSALVLGLGGCSAPDFNRSLYSLNQPVVERTHYTLDVAAGPGGLPIPEQRRLAGWFEALDLDYGDRVAVEADTASPATIAAVAGIVERYGLLLSEQAPVTEGFVEPGRTRVVVTRSVATVPTCPDWSDDGDGNFANATSRNYGCATNSNYAAMVANPEDLVRGQSSRGGSSVNGSTRAIEAYRSGGSPSASSATATGSGSPD